MPCSDSSTRRINYLLNVVLCYLSTLSHKLNGECRYQDKWKCWSQNILVVARGHLYLRVRRKCMHYIL